ncbi:hypothetical protein [Raoultella ornithinolytica]|uniref:hypothetical protein n=1 Tax=Raoultella ornithinolytica TaxID=54291 RepID=UPI002FE720F2|nr:hypothetical protein [Raoultella ornithinolytica]
MNKKKTFEVSINNLPAEQVKVIEDYKKQFPFLIEDEENVLVSLDQLWEALDTPYYTPSGKGAESSDHLAKPRSESQEKVYRRKQHKKWRDEVALKEIDNEPFSRMVPVRGRTDSEILAFHLGDEAD